MSKLQSKNQQIILLLETSQENSLLAKVDLLSREEEAIKLSNLDPLRLINSVLKLNDPSANLFHYVLVVQIISAEFHPVKYNNKFP